MRSADNYAAPKLHKGDYEVRPVCLEFAQRFVAANHYPDVREGRRGLSRPLARHGRGPRSKKPATEVAGCLPASYWAGYSPAISARVAASAADNPASAGWNT